jgi:predicted transcriptional regulator
MLRIKQARLLLNGKHKDGSKATFSSNFKYTRYAIVILAAISMSNFEYHTKKIQNAAFISYYNLYKVAKFLGIEFERTKSAPYVYNELVDRGQVKIVTEDNRTFITLTEKGKKSCEEKLEELQLLNEHFNENPSYQQKYREGEEWKGTRVKGAKQRSQRQTDIETEIDKLIKKISQW